MRLIVLLALSAALLPADDITERLGTVEQQLEHLSGLVKDLQVKLSDQQKQIADLQQGRSAVGMIVPYAGAIDENGLKQTGWLICDGRPLTINDENRALFNAIGTAFGGNGQTTFNLPDLQGRAAVGAGGQHARGAAFGAARHALAGAELPDHTHSIPAHAHRYWTVVAGNTGSNLLVIGPGVTGAQIRAFDSSGTAEGFKVDANALAQADYYTEMTPSQTTQLTSGKGTGQEFDIVSPSLAVNFLIRYK